MISGGAVRKRYAKPYTREQAQRIQKFFSDPAETGFASGTYMELMNSTQTGNEALQ
jgi:hypothetical protein